MRALLWSFWTGKVQQKQVRELFGQLFGENSIWFPGNGFDPKRRYQMFQLSSNDEILNKFEKYVGISVFFTGKPKLLTDSKYYKTRKLLTRLKRYQVLFNASTSWSAFENTSFNIWLLVLSFECLRVFEYFKCLTKLGLMGYLIDPMRRRNFLMFRMFSRAVKHVQMFFHVVENACNIWRSVSDVRREPFWFTNILQSRTSGRFEHVQWFECFEMCS